MAAEVERPHGFTRISRKRQVTLPSAALDAAHLRPGEELQVTVDDRGRVVLTPVDDPLEALISSAPDLSADTNLSALRDEGPVVLDANVNRALLDPDDPLHDSSAE